MSKQCSCRRGYRSTWDNKCFECRTKEEQELHTARMEEVLTYSITVANRHHKAVGEYIGRGTPLGNMFSHMEGTQAEFKVDTREEAVELYTKELHHAISIGEPSVIQELDRLAHILLDTKKLTLVCSCAPKACHGNSIRDVLYKALYDNCTPG